LPRILKKEALGPEVVLFEIAAPRVSRRRKAGQFVILRLTPTGERFPLTIADADPAAGTITIVVQAVGKSTMQLARLGPGDEILDLAGPLGNPTHVERFGHVVGVGGGVGTAVLYPIVKAMKAAGNRLTVVLGARTKDLLILVDRMRAVADDVLLATDDGSAGAHGFVTDVLGRLIERDEGIDMVAAVGPVVMMRAVCRLTEGPKIPTVVSLNPIMLDGTGMCGGCRVTVGGERRFACVDGPEFDGHIVDFDELMVRQSAYVDDERSSRDAFCRLDEAPRTKDP
jgi:ferredoxin--NADP+ reductase